MSFASVDFLVFFAVVVAGATLIDRFGTARFRELFLLAASYFFYGYWDWRFCFLLLSVTIVSWFAAEYADKEPVFRLGVIVPLIVLGIFKYFNFFLSSVTSLLGRDVGALRIILPVGISFYTFQALSYVIDVHRGKIAAEHDFVRLALYLSFFPQLVAGPIVRAADFLPQLKERRTVTAAGVSEGIQIFVFGLFKKIVFADHLAVFVDDVFAKPEAFHWATIVWAIVSYAIQIYFDFSGYSDMAIGCARCLGYDFNRNFNLPYVATSVTELWRRWHISLSTWLKEYLYIPLGGNRRGKARSYLNLFLTMLLGGLWHGADWTFVFWGGLNGAALCLDKRLSSGKRRSGWMRGAGWLLTMLFFDFTLIFFRSDSFATAWAVIRGIFGGQNGIRQPYAWSFAAVMALLAGTLAALKRSAEVKAADADGFYPIVNLNSVGGLTVFFVTIGLILGLAYTGENPFVYFQF